MHYCEGDSRCDWVTFPAEDVASQDLSETAPWLFGRRETQDQRIVSVVHDVERRKI